jgi:uncharacterized protein (TIGR02246 family)
MTRFLATVCLITICFAEMGAGHSDARATIAKLKEAWLAAYKAADFGRLAGLYTEDAVVMPEGREPLQGRAAIREFFAEDFRYIPKRSITFTSLRVEGSSNLLVDSGEYRYVGTDIDGKAVHITGNYITVFRKIGGTWQTAVEVWNVANAREKAGGKVRPLTKRTGKPFRSSPKTWALPCERNRRMLRVPWTL